MLTFTTGPAVAIGEAMIEMAVIGEDTYRRSFAGDTFNTIWHMSQMIGDERRTGFVTRIGTDSVSDSFVRLMEADGLDTSGVGREADRTMGLYMIELAGTERHFHYWRSTSAARRLADDATALQGAIRGAALIHLSGITLAILAPAAREILWAALADARKSGARVSFDPNVRPRLWSSADESRATLTRFLQVTDIALPSFDDENSLWGDRAPHDTLARLRQSGVAEIAVKDGAGPVVAVSGADPITVMTPPVSGILDTSGAGDAFNAGYLAARLRGEGQAVAIACGQCVSAEVIRHFGARIPKAHIPRGDGPCP